MDGEIPSWILEFSPDPYENKKIAEKFLEKGLIGGPELFLLDAPQGVNTFGVESPGLYKKELDLFRRVYKNKSLSDSFLEARKSKIVKQSQKRIHCA